MLLVAAPPLSPWRIVLGLVLGLKAQVLFMAPFTAAFSRLIGRHRVTNALTTALCLAPLVGAACGTAAAPLLLPLAGSPLFLVVASPAALALAIVLATWRIASVESWRPPSIIGSGTGAHDGSGRMEPLLQQPLESAPRPVPSFPWRSKQQLWRAPTPSEC